MLRKIVSDGDLMLIKRPWWGGYVGMDWEPHRNLSEEIRLLKEHRDNALSKYVELSKLHVIGNKNVTDELETLQVLLLDNSEAYFPVDVDNSILEEREGVKYNFGRNNKQGNASSNKEQQQQQRKKREHRKQISLLEALSSAKLTVH